MKNKTKKDKGRKKAGSEKQIYAAPEEWLYFSQKQMNVRDIFSILSKDYEVEIWEEAEVLEISFKEGGSMDIEAGSIHPKDEITNTFAQKNRYINVFLVTFVAEEDQQARRVMEQILAEAGGIFCGDNEDFTPRCKPADQEK